MNKAYLYRIAVALMFIVCSTIAMAQNKTHTIARGETLQSIAAKYGVTEDAIRKANPNMGDMFYVGMKLNIPNDKSKTVTSVNNVPLKAKESGQERNDAAQYQQHVENSTTNSNNVQQNLNQEQEGGTDIVYHAIENGWGIGFSFVNSYFILGYDYLFGKKGDVLSNNSGMELYIGGNYRYHVTDIFYLEGRIIAGYYHWKTEYKKKEYKDYNNSINEAFLGISPRAGLKFGKVALSAGYRWDWVKMKFEKEYSLDRFTIGLTVIL